MRVEQADNGVWYIEQNHQGFWALIAGPGARCGAGNDDKTRWCLILFAPGITTFHEGYYDSTYLAMLAIAWDWIQESRRANGPAAFDNTTVVL